MHVRILTYGGILQSIEVPDRARHLANISLGFATLDQYVQRSPFFGALIGRFANRIAYGRFTLDEARTNCLSTMARIHCTAASTALTNACGKPARCAGPTRSV
jgi:galactose mutarotase-like enzyme